MYKSQLQEYAQKAGLMPPTYDHVKEGAPHEPRFKSTVWVNNLSYESPPGFLTVRSADHAAAKVALDSLQSQASGLTPSSVHESGLCKNLLQEFAQKNGYSLPQYKIMRQGKEHSLIFTATVDIAGVSYSGGGAKSKKEAEIKAARTALLAIQATQPAAKGSSAAEPQPVPAQPQPCQVANFVKSHPKRKKRGRLNPSLLEEPLAIRMKQGLGYLAGPMQPPQMYPMPQIPQLSQIHLSPVNQMAQVYPVNPVGYSGEAVMPVQWNQELGICSRSVFSEPMQVGQIVLQNSAMTTPDLGAIPAAVQGTAPTTLDASVLPMENIMMATPGNLEAETAVVFSEPVKGGQVVAQDIPPLGNTETSAAVAVSEGLTVQKPTDLQQGGQDVAEDTATTKSNLENIPAAAVQGTAPTLVTHGEQQGTAPTLVTHGEQQGTAPTLVTHGEQQGTAPTLVTHGEQQGTAPTLVTNGEQQGTAPTLVTHGEQQGTAPTLVTHGEQQGTAPTLVTHGEQQGTAPTLVTHGEQQGTAPTLVTNGEHHPTGNSETTVVGTTVETEVTKLGPAGN